MDIKQYLDSTYLKTAEQANLSEEKNTETIKIPKIAPNVLATIS